MIRKSTHIAPPDNLHDYAPLLNWDQQEALKKIQEMYQSALNISDSTINWYRKYRRRKGGWARVFRACAIMLLVLSTIMPFIGSISREELIFLCVGYIMAALGGGLMLFDRHYAFSNNWMRFVLTGMDLEMIRNEFIEKWQIQLCASLPLTRERFCILVETISTFRRNFQATVKAETEVSAAENLRQFEELASKLNAKTEELRLSVEEEIRKATQKEAVITAPVDNPIPEEIFEEAKDKLSEEWKQTYNVKGVAIGRKVTDDVRVPTFCIILYPAFKLKEGKDQYTPIPKFIPYGDYQLPTDVRELNGAIKAISSPAGLCDTQPLKRPGCSVARVGDRDLSGTIGLKVFKKGKEYLLSCYHVLCHPELTVGRTKFDPVKSNGSPMIESPSQEDEENVNKRVQLAAVVEGELTDELDGAIAIINSTVSLHDSFCSFGGKAKDPLEITNAHVDQPLSVRSVGRTSGELRGVIESRRGDYDVEYTINDETVILKMKNIICTNQEAQGGDSGAAVVDLDNNVVGIIFAVAPNNKTLVTPIDRLLTKFKVTLKA